MGNPDQLKSHVPSQNGRIDAEPGRLNDMVKRVTLILISFMILMPLQAADLVTLRGRLFLPPDQPGQAIDVVLRQGKHVVSRLAPDDKNNYEFANLANGRYELAIKIGKQQVKVPINLCCSANTVSVVDVNLDQNSPTIAVSFPLDPPDIVDVRALKRDYPREILREFDQARNDIRSGKMDRAAERLKQVVKSAPDFYSARALMGMVFHSSGCYLDAEREYLRAFELNPKSAQPMINLGSLYIEAADARLRDDRQYIDEAITILKKAIFVQPNSSLAYCLLGSAYFKNESYTAAEESLNKALQRVRSPAAAHLMLADVYLKQKKWTDAISEIDIYLRENPFGPGRKDIINMRKGIVSSQKSSD
jgi:tetratricopeptide (TPR) repeat protein